MTDKTSGTIQEDVPSVEIEAKDQEFIPRSEAGDEAEPTLNEDDPRAAIYAKYDQKRREEMGVEPPAPEAAPEPVAVAPTKPEEVTVKVNGKEIKVPKAKIDEAGGVAAYQKIKAADELLRQAGEERRRAQDAEVQLNQKIQALNQYEQELKQRAAQAPAAAPQNQVPVKELARKYHEAILDGNMDQADDLLIALQTARGSATVNEGEIARKAAAAAKAELIREQQAEKQQAFEKERLEASASFNDDYPDIAEDPELFKLANAKTLEIYQRNPSLGPKAIFEKAVSDVRTWIAGRKGSTTASDKLDAKRQQTTIRGASAKATTRPAPKPQSPSQYVEQLRRARGLGI